MGVLCVLEELVFDVVKPFREMLSMEGVSLSIGGMVEGVGAVLHLMGFLPREEEERRVSVLNRKGNVLFVAPSRYHEGLIAGEGRFLSSDYPIKWIKDCSSGRWTLMDDVEKPYIFFIPYGCGWNGLREVFMAFKMASSRLNSNISLLLALYGCGRKEYEAILQVAEEEDVIDRLQPVFLECIDDLGVLIENAVVCIGLLYEGLYPYFELASLSVGVPVATLPTAVVCEKMAGYAEIAECTTPYALADSIIKVRTATVSGEIRERLMSFLWSDVFEKVRELL